jgi:hypothetical protein
MMTRDCGPISRAVAERESVVVGEADLRVRPIAERLVLRCATPAQRRLGTANAGFGSGAPDLECALERERPAGTGSHPEDAVDRVAVCPVAVVHDVFIRLEVIVHDASIRLEVDVDVAVVTERLVP